MLSKAASACFASPDTFNVFFTLTNCSSKAAAAAIPPAKAATKDAPTPAAVVCVILKR